MERELPSDMFGDEISEENVELAFPSPAGSCSAVDLVFPTPVENSSAAATSSKNSSGKNAPTKGRGESYVAGTQLDVFATGSNSKKKSTKTKANSMVSLFAPPMKMARK